MKYEINNENKFDRVDFCQTPNASGIIKPKFLVLHFTAGRGFAKTTETFMDARSKASAHLLIGREAVGFKEIRQFVPFNKKAWHAGPSKWKGLTKLNDHAIGIEFDNYGQVFLRGEFFYTWFEEKVDPEEIYHDEATDTYWHTYTSAQLEVGLDAATALVDGYGLVDVVGHSDIAPRRKTDPGPAFPMAKFQSILKGREADDETDDYITTADNLNLRTGPGIDFEVLAKLKSGTKVEVLQEQGNWWYVDVQDDENVIEEGWVHRNYLKAV